jgi:hypothetical protein
LDDNSEKTMELEQEGGDAEFDDVAVEAHFRATVAVEDNHSQEEPENQCREHFAVHRHLQAQVVHCIRLDGEDIELDHVRGQLGHMGLADTADIQLEVRPEHLAKVEAVAAEDSCMNSKPSRLLGLYFDLHKTENALTQITLRKFVKSI